MGLIAEEKVAAVTKWLHEELWPELQQVFSSTPYWKYLLILLAVLILILMSSKKNTKTHNIPNEQTSFGSPKGGYKNFKGDKWYPDGRVWNNNKRSWENPDYSKKE